MRRIDAAAAIVGVVLFAPACFDVHAVALDAFLIDDFEDNDKWPADPNLFDWKCNTFSPSSNKLYHCNLEERGAEGYSMYLDLTIVDVPDGFQQNGGASLTTRANRPEDFTRFTRIVFDLRLESSAESPLTSNTLVLVELGCATARTESGSQPGDLYVAQNATYGDAWHTTSLTIGNFAASPFDNPPQPIAGGTSACLRDVDNIRFTVGPQLPDGGMARGILHVDNIKLE